MSSEPAVIQSASDRQFDGDHPARIVLIGAGGIGNRHIRGFLATGRARLDIVEPDPDKRKRVSEDYPVEAVHDSIDAIDLATFDGAVISAPAHTHVPIGMRCAEAGVGFLVEKPLAVTMDGVDDLCDRVAEAGIAVRVGYVRRSSEDTRSLRDRARSGEIGNLKLAYLNYSQDYRKYRPDYREIYYARESQGGGAILDAASHAIDLLMWIFGSIAEVSAYGDRMVFEGVECEDTVLMMLRFASGSFAQIAINQFQKPNVQVVEVIGTEGNLRLDLSRLEKATGDSGTWDGSDCFEGMEPMEVHEGRFRLQADLFLDSLCGAETGLTTLDEARENLRVALAAKESIRTGRSVAIRPGG